MLEKTAWSAGNRSPLLLSGSGMEYKGATKGPTSLDGCPTAQARGYAALAGGTETSISIT